jgi:hypothetical protein
MAGAASDARRLGKSMAQNIGYIANFESAGDSKQINAGRTRFDDYDITSCISG